MIDLLSKYSYLSVWSEAIAWSLCIILLACNIWLWLRLSRKDNRPVEQGASTPNTVAPVVSPAPGTAACGPLSADQFPPSECNTDDAGLPGPKEETAAASCEAAQGFGVSLYTLRSFLRLSEVYRIHYDDMVKAARRKLAGGQTEELLTSLKSDKTTKQPKVDFLKKFDEAVGLLIPDFTVKLNQLLEAEKQLPTSGEGLDAETRIAAMMSLGETDSQTIADTLGLSLNTVYSYRNRLKSRARNREGFEGQIRGLAIKERT